MSRRLFQRLAKSERGAIAIETAVITPVLLLMALGSFEGSMMVARQVDLQNAASEASQLALAAAPTDEAARATVKAVIQTSTGLTADDVSVLERYRCDTQDEYVESSSDCTSHYSRFIRIEIKDTYTPSWSAITGLDPIDYDVIRYVQVG